MSTEREAAPTGGSERQGSNGHRIRTHCTRRHRVYLAVPRSAPYDTKHHAACRSLVASVWPDVEIVEGTRAFGGDRRRFPALLRSMDGLVFAARPDGTIDAGLLEEVVEAAFCQVPVTLATPDRLVPIEDVGLRLLTGGWSDHFAAVTVVGR